MGTPVNVSLDGSVVNLESNGTNYFVSTVGGAQEILSIDGNGVADGDEITVTNNGPDAVTLRHDQGNSGTKLFLPNNTDRVLQPTGKPYWFQRNQNGPKGDGWYEGEDPP